MPAIWWPGSTMTTTGSRWRWTNPAIRCATGNSALGLAGSRPQEIEAAKLAMLDAQADLEQKKKDYARYQALYVKDEIPGQTRDLAATNVTRAQAEYDRDRQIYNELLEGTRKEELAVERANLHQAEQNLHMSRIRLAYTVLRAPFNGVVLERQAELGEVVSPGTPIVTLADLDHLWVRVYVPETDLGKSIGDSRWMCGRIRFPTGSTTAGYRSSLRRRNSHRRAWRPKRSA